MKFHGNSGQQETVFGAQPRPDTQCLESLSAVAPTAELLKPEGEVTVTSKGKRLSSKQPAFVKEEVLKNLQKSRRGELLLVPDSRHADIVTLISAATLRCSKFFSGLGWGYVGPLAQRLREKLGPDVSKVPEEEIASLAVEEATRISQSIQDRRKKGDSGISRLEEKAIRMSEVRYR